MAGIERKKTNVVQVGGLLIGGSHPVVIQSMCNTDTRNVKATIAQIAALETSGCELVRVAVPDEAAAEALPSIKAGIQLPLVADIHFDYRLALMAMQAGVDKIRLNPGNIGSTERIRQVVEEAKARQIPIRIGVNSGSLEKDLLERYSGVTPQGLVESALRHVHILESMHFYDIVISIKASSVPFSIEAYERLSAAVPYPLHIGITEAGTAYAGTIKSAVGIGSILSRGIGDTLRVSLTADPTEEIRAAKEILVSLGMRHFGVELISCPTCGRTEVDLIGLATAVEERCQHIRKHIKVAVMGCVVNGPGEAAEADIGIAGGRGQGILFRKGKILNRMPESELLPALMAEIERLAQE